MQCQCSSYANTLALTTAKFMWKEVDIIWIESHNLQQMSNLVANLFLIASLEVLQWLRAVYPNRKAGINLTLRNLDVHLHLSTISSPMFVGHFYMLTSLEHQF